MNIVEDCCSNK